MINRVERPRVKSFVERKNEEAELLQKKEQQIKQQLTTIKNNQKFSKVINISLITLENLISKDNSEHLINIKLIIKLNGIKILCNITSVNSENEEIIDKATMLLKNLIKNDNKKTFELSKIFLEKNGQNDIFQLLISLKNDKGIYNLLEIIYILIPIPQFFNILMESEMIDTIKFLIEFNFNKIHITNLLNKIIAKITNHKKGRDLLINDEFVKKIRENIEKNIKEQNQEQIIDELIILDNILKNDNGKIIIKKSNIYKNLSEGLSVFFDNDELTKMKQGLEAEKTFFEGYGGKYMIVVVPNKENMYTEYMPERMQKIRQSEVSRSDAGIIWLQQNSQLNVLNLKPFLLAEKENFKYPLYYQKDTHWNAIGAYIGYQKIAEELKKTGIHADLQPLTSEMISPSGLVGQDMHPTDKDMSYAIDYQSQKTYRKRDVIPNKVIVYENDNPMYEETLLIAGDSFARGMLPYFAKIYRRVVNVPAGVKDLGFYEDVLKKYKPDITIHELVERYFCRLVNVGKIYKKGKK